MRLSFLFLLTLAALPLFAADQKDKPKEKPWELAPGWKVEVLASSDNPDKKILYTSVVCALPDGRILAAEDPMDMIGPGKEPKDRVLCFHPDGKVTVFAENLYAVYGLQYIDGKVYIHHSPKFSVFTDDNGVGKDRKDIYDSDNLATWGGGSLNDHIPANMHLAMDGYFYMAVGDKGIFGAKSNIDGRTAELHGGGLLRIRPDGTGMEVVVTGTRNHLDVSLNSEDEMFTYDNTDDGKGWWTRFTYMVDGGFYGYPYDYRPATADKANYEKYKTTKGVNPFKPYTLWRAEEYGGGSPTGAIGYNEDALPDEFRGNLFHCEWGKGAIERFVVERDGGTYKITKREAILKGGPGSFRPVGICVTQDGTGFYIGDWNYAGWANKKIVSGRLLKLTYTGAPSKAAPKPAWYVPAAQGQKFEATTAELVEALKHPAQSVRMVAQRRLIERKDEALQPILSLLQDKKAPPQARWHAVWVQDAIEAGREIPPALGTILNDASDDISVRRQIARALGERQAHAAVPWLLTALEDKDQSLRFKAATALGRIGDALATVPLLQHLSEKDFFTHYAVFTALNRIGLHDTAAWRPIVAALGSQDAAQRDGAAFAMRNAYDEALATELSMKIADTNAPAELRAQALAVIAPLEKKAPAWDGKWWGTGPQANPAPAHTVNWAATPRIIAAIRAGLESTDPKVRVAAIEALKVAPDPNAGQLLADLFAKDKDTALLKKALQALAASKSTAGETVVAKLLKDPAANTELIPDAIEFAKQLGDKDMLAALIDFVSHDAAPDQLLLALSALGAKADPQVVPALIKRLTDTDAKVAASAAEALGNQKGKEVLAALTTAIHDTRDEVGKAALAALGNLRTNESIEALLAASKEPKLTNAARLALCTKPDVRAAEEYLEGMSSKDGDTRNACNKAMRDVRQKALPIVEKRLESNPPPMQVIAQLKGFYEKDDWAQKSKLFSFDTKALSPEAFAKFAQTHAGDAKKGANVFKSTTIACNKCHKIGNEGGDVGPALAGVGQKYPKDFLIDSILYPSKQILDGYHQVQIMLEDGRVLSGLVKGESETELTLVDSTAKPTLIKKSEIKKRAESKLSLMPEGQQSAMTQDEFADLIAYLESLKEKPPEPKKAPK